MKDSDTLWKKAQHYQKSHNYREAAKTYLKAAQIDIKNNKKKKDASTEFSCAGTCLYNIGDLDGALKCYKEALEIDEQLGDLKGKSIVLNNIGSILSDRGDLDGALKYYKEALEIAEQLGDLKGKTTRLNNIWNILRDRN